MCVYTSTYSYICHEIYQEDEGNVYCGLLLRFVDSGTRYRYAQNGMGNWPTYE